MMNMQRSALCRVNSQNQLQLKSRSCKPATRSVRNARRVVKVASGAEIDPGCKVDDFENCSLGDLELMYIDALWNYYHDGEFTLSDEEYDRLREELNWQGSGFPTLKKDEVDFVEASIMYARGKPIVSDEEYEELKMRVKKEGARTDVTALLLFSKGQQLLDSTQYTVLADEMSKLGIDVGLKGASCTLNKTPEEIENDVVRVAQMYLALAALPAGATFLGWGGLSVFANFPFWPATYLSIIVGAIASYKIADFTGLINSEIYVGTCPCCETKVKQQFGGADPPAVKTLKCTVCGTAIDFDRTSKKLSLSSGAGFVEG